MISRFHAELATALGTAVFGAVVVGVDGFARVALAAVLGACFYPRLYSFPKALTPAAFGAAGA